MQFPVAGKDDSTNAILASTNPVSGNYFSVIGGSHSSGAPSLLQTTPLKPLIFVAAGCTIAIVTPIAAWFPLNTLQTGLGRLPLRVVNPHSYHSYRIDMR